MKLAPLVIGFAFVASFAFADALSPDDSVVTEQNASSLNAKIIEVTGQKPHVFMGKKVVSAKANVVCSQFPDATVTCVVEVQK